MGVGYEYHCDKCGHCYNVNVGCGFLYPIQYQKCVQRIKKGKYGAEWRRLYLSNPRSAVDVEMVLFLCVDCGAWKTARSLDLYVPKGEAENNSEMDSDIQRTDLYVMKYELREHYQLLSKCIRKCRKCGGNMVQFDLEEQVENISLKCPKCSTENYPAAIECWD